MAKNLLILVIYYAVFEPEALFHFFKDICGLSPIFVPSIVSLTNAAGDYQEQNEECCPTTTHDCIFWVGLNKIDHIVVPIFFCLFYKRRSVINWVNDFPISRIDFFICVGISFGVILILLLFNLIFYFFIIIVLLWHFIFFLGVWIHNRDSDVQVLVGFLLDVLGFIVGVSHIEYCVEMSEEWLAQDPGVTDLFLLKVRKIARGR